MLAHFGCYSRKAAFEKVNCHSFVEIHGNCLETRVVLVGMREVLAEAKGALVEMMEDQVEMT